MRDHLQWLPLLDDEDLVARLEDILLQRAEGKPLRPTNRVRVADFVHGPLFKTFDPALQARILDKLQDLERRRRYRGGKQEANLGRVPLQGALF